MGERNPDLSIVFGTYNRLSYLAPMMLSVRQAAKGLDFDFVITDGGSTDGTLEILRQQSDVTLIEHGKLLGPVKAYNDAFALAKGKYVAHLNDDVILPKGMLSAAVQMLDEDAGIGQVAFRYKNPTGGGTLGSCKSKGTRHLFASFGVTRRELGEKAGWFDGFYHYNGDCHLSMSIWAMGFQVVELPGYVLDHFAADNAVRGERRWTAPNAREKMRQDWRKWGETWG